MPVQHGGFPRVTVDIRNNYFFVDGSALLADVRRARHDKRHAIAPDAKLDIEHLAHTFVGPLFRGIHGGTYRRFVYYFVGKDERLESEIVLPDPTRQNAMVDLRVEYCGKRIREYEQAREWADKHEAPQVVLDCLYRSEKAVDTRICCDALQLAAIGGLDRLFLYTNDYDFVPLSQTLRRMGVNVNLLRIGRDHTVNEQLVRECDGFHVLDIPELQFVKPPQVAPAVPAAAVPQRDTVS